MTFRTFDATRALARHCRRFAWLDLRHGAYAGSLAPNVPREPTRRCHLSLQGSNSSLLKHHGIVRKNSKSNEGCDWCAGPIWRRQASLLSDVPRIMLFEMTAGMIGGNVNAGGAS